MTARFLGVTPVKKSFSSDLLPTIISYSTKLHLDPLKYPRWSSCAKIAYDRKTSTISAKSSVADVRLDFKCISDWKGAINVGCT